MKDKNGVEWADGKHKYSLTCGGVKAETYVVNVGGREVLIRLLGDDCTPTIYTQKQASEHLTFVEPPETVDDIRDEILDLYGECFPTRKYCNNHVLGTKDCADIAAMNHIIDRVVKAMEDKNNV